MCTSLWNVFTHVHLAGTQIVENYQTIPKKGNMHILKVSEAESNGYRDTRTQLLEAQNEYRRWAPP